MANASLARASARAAARHYTQAELYHLFDPSNARLPYVFDDFEWAHCADAWAGDAGDADDGSAVAASSSAAVARTATLLERVARPPSAPRGIALSAEERDDIGAVHRVKLAALVRDAERAKAPVRRP